MHILIGLAMGVALLYFWLIGHWFARVLVFLLLACVGGLGGTALGADQGGKVVSAILGIALAWPIAGLPVYYWRYQVRRLLLPEQPPKPPASKSAHQIEWESYAARH